LKKEKPNLSLYILQGANSQEFRQRISNKNIDYKIYKVVSETGLR